MKQKREKQKKPKETEAVNSSFVNFYGLLDTLLPQSSKLLRETLERRKEALEHKSPKEKDEIKAFLEFEKEKNDCLSELLGIAIDQYQRVSADYANFQKRVPKQIADTICYEKERIIKTLLPALDNFEHTLQNADSAENSDVFVKGIQIIYDQMLDIFKSHGVSPPQIDYSREKSFSVANIIPRLMAWLTAAWVMPRFFPISGWVSPSSSAAQ